MHAGLTQGAGKFKPCVGGDSIPEFRTLHVSVRGGQDYAVDP